MASSKILERQKLEQMTTEDFSHDFVNNCTQENCAYCFLNNTNYCMLCDTSCSDYNGTCFSSCPQRTFEFTFIILSTGYKSCADCYENCETCERGEEKDNDGKLINMKCNTCKNYLAFFTIIKERHGSSGRRIEIIEFIGDICETDGKCYFVYLDAKNVPVIKLGENCFPLVKNTENEIIFNISSLTAFYPENTTGTCYMFNKTIYANSSECIEKPENTYYVINDVNNTGVIKNCSEACKSCEIGNTPENTNCLECANGYSHSLNEIGPPYNCSKNECYHTCLNCSDVPTMNETDIIDQNCITCIDGCHKKVDTNDCYDDSITEKGYYLSSIDSKYHLCDIECKPRTDKNNCTLCNSEKGYYPMDNEDQVFCYNNKTINNNYILYEINNTNFLWKRCYELCQTCYDIGNVTNMNCLSCNLNLFLTDIGNCVSICPDGSYQFNVNNTCLQFCPYGYIIDNDKCIKKQIDKITSEEFKNELLSNINSFVNSSSLINGSDFIAVVLPSDKIDPKEQLKKAFQL